jgi:hypothetical protein
MKRLLVGVIAASVSLAALPAWAVTETTTRGRVNDRTMEQFGAYTFKGTTRPSDKGHIVDFHFRPVGTERWRPFKVGPADGRNAFFVLDHNRPRDRINSRHRWKILFTPGARPGRWVLRARFIRQDGLARSAVKRWVRVRGSD